MKRFLSKNIFWVLQCFGWSLFVISLQFFGDKESLSKIVYDVLTGVLVVVVATSFLRYLLNKSNFSYLPFTFFDFIKLFSALIAASLVFYGLNYLTDFFEVETTVNEKESEEWAFLSSFVIIFFLLVFWVILYLLIKIFVGLNRQKIERIELITTLNEAQLNTLKGQINPHFLFNSINNIRGLMLEDVGKSQEMISKLSEMLEYAFAKNTVDAIPLREELEMVENYIALSKIQMEDRLQYVEEIDDETLQIPIPPMIIQLLIENAAKHGIANLKEGGTIALKVLKENENLFITVANTGKLKIAKDSTQLGLKNIRQRLRLLYGKKATFSLEEVEEEVVASIIIPLE
ncbi:sensor histidine kinase [Zobellia uliginosa]|uniref:sensor histidine kinase n=1 Tax=Zobellia uliginosa TaxID=143224 RepID=UPI001C0653F7|nr:histidine kinase [Zobellia uliginosa]MBU2947569.1 histidine kinase [Zobellia uliginosa]